MDMRVHCTFMGTSSNHRVLPSNRDNVDIHQLGIEGNTYRPDFSSARTDLGVPPRHFLLVFLLYRFLSEAAFEEGRKYSAPRTRTFGSHHFPAALSRVAQIIKRTKAGGVSSTVFYICRLTRFRLTGFLQLEAIFIMTHADEWLD